MTLRRAVLVIADIGGYTAFLQAHRVGLAHAQDIVGRLLETVIDAAPRLALAEVEGDAVFLSAWAPEGAAPAVAREAFDQILAMHRAFRARRHEIAALNLCPCHGCGGVARLALKFVVHLGDVATQTVKGVVKPAGLEVVLAHRMLKNRVPVAEYVLMSEPLFRVADERVRRRGRALEQEFEGLGRLPTYFVDLDEFAGEMPPAPRVTWAGRLRETGGVAVRSLPALLGFRRPERASRGLG